jgi:hypothetical protein
LRELHPRPRLLPPMSGVLFSPDSRVLAGLGFQRAGDVGSGGVTLWETVEGRQRARIPGTDHPQAFTPDSKGIFMAPLGRGAEVKLYDAQTGQRLRTYDCGGGGKLFSTVGPYYLAVTPDSRTLAVAVTSPASVKRPVGLKGGPPRGDRHLELSACGTSPGGILLMASPSAAVP